MAEKQVKGRGAALLERLKKQKEEEALGLLGRPGLGPDLEKVPPKARGRAAMLQKLKEMKEAKVGGGAGDAPVPLSSSSPAPGPRREPPSMEGVDPLAREFQDLAVGGAPEPQSYSFKGKDGNPLRATANYIRLNVEKDRGLFEYEVRFDPDLDARSSRVKILKETLNHFLGDKKDVYSYDGGALLFLPFQYIDREEYATVQPYDPEQQVTCTLIFKKKMRFSECIRFYNILFKRIMGILLYTRMGRNYFNPEHRHVIPQHKLEVLPGYAVTVDEMEGGLMVCVDTQHRVIRAQTVYEVLGDVQAANPPSRFKDAATQAILGASILTRYNNATYKIDDIAWNMTPRDTFDTRDGTKRTFIEYYKQHYNIQIDDLDQPMLLNRRKTKEAAQQGAKDSDQMIALVPELCFMTGLTDAMRADFKVMKDVAAFTRITPQQRQMALRTYLSKVRQTPEAQHLLAKWGLSLAPDTVALPARVLPSETVKFGGGMTVPAGMDWNRGITENRVTGPKDLVDWHVYFTTRDQKFAENFIDTVGKLARNIGITVNRPRAIKLPDDRSETYLNAIQNNHTAELQACVFICPTLRADRYTVIKKMTLCKYPVASQVILSKTLANPQKVRTIIHKIILQIICKMGGSLWEVHIPAREWMVCGIDVYHGDGNRSVCGFVANINETYTRWYSEVAFQEQEIADSLRLMFRNSLVVFHKKRGHYPEKVVVTRDGVGDGQLDHCLRYEVQQFLDVIADMKIDTTLTYTVIQKRINTRLYEINGNNAVNPPAGTVADSEVTRRNWYDFYLVPQSVRQGTVNPTHYIVIYNGGNIKPDHLQRLAYKLCHLYFNWSGAVRVPAPCQYAHKLAQVIGMYVKAVPDISLSEKLYYL